MAVDRTTRSELEQFVDGLFGALERRRGFTPAQRAAVAHNFGELATRIAFLEAGDAATAARLALAATEPGEGQQPLAYDLQVGYGNGVTAVEQTLGRNE